MEGVVVVSGHTLTLGAFFSPIEWVYSRIVDTKDEVCDFCLSDQPAFVHETVRFFLPGQPAYVEMDGAWGACAQCHELILAGDLGELTERLATSQVPNVDLTAPGVAYHERVLRGFWDYRTTRWWVDA